jgi:DNA-binding MarR family transcriptional regulator
MSLNLVYLRYMSKTIKLTDKDIVSIRKIYENMDITQKELADMFMISQGHLSRVVRNLRRKTHVTDGVE